MKNLKLLVTIFFAGLFLISVSSCRKRCKDGQPQARIINRGTDKASVQIKTSNGNTVNTNNVDPGTTSAYVGYAAGQITYTIVVNNKTTVEVVNMSNCYDYDIVIDANNNISTSANDRNN